MMPKRPAAKTMPMIDQIATAIAKADGGDIATDPARYRRIPFAALRPLAKSTEQLIDAAYEAVSFDDQWAITSRMLYPNGDLSSGRDFLNRDPANDPDRHHWLSGKMKPGVRDQYPEDDD
jgi:hypothetical protein